MLFKTKEGKDQLKEIKHLAKTFVPGQPLSDGDTGRGRPVTNASGLTPEQVRNIKEAIARSSSPEVMGCWSSRTSSLVVSIWKAVIMARVIWRAFVAVETGLLRRLDKNTNVQLKIKLLSCVIVMGARCKKKNHTRIQHQRWSQTQQTKLAKN